MNAGKILLGCVAFIALYGTFCVPVFLIGYYFLEMELVDSVIIGFFMVPLTGLISLVAGVVMYNFLACSCKKEDDILA